MFSKPSLERAYTYALCLVATGSLVAAGPCDIYSSGGTPCLAAHSTTRALYNAYNGALYQVKRGSNNATTDIKPLSAGGVANAATQDSFCASTTCLITIIYDQSGRGNHLTQAPPGYRYKGPAAGGYDNLASATGAPVTLNGQKAYGVFIAPGTGYRNDATSGIATKDVSEGMYAVFDGTHYNTGCCFDYGNAETNNKANGPGTMEAIYFGTNKQWGTGAGSGPWIMADFEDGLFSGQNAKNNAADPSISHRFITAVVKGGSNQWSIRGGNAASGSLSTFYSGVRPTGYNPMKKEGAIILGIGGDNSIGAQGTFYEGVMTSGYPSDATENSVQANIVAAKYGTASLASDLTVGSSISLRATTSCCTTRYITHEGSVVNAQVVSSSSSTALKKQASWTVRAGLGGSSDCFSFESADTAGSYIQLEHFQLQVKANNGTQVYRESATFCPDVGLNGKGTSLRSWNHPTRYVRHYNYVLYTASNGGLNAFDAPSSFNDDVSWVVDTGFA